MYVKSTTQPRYVTACTLLLAVACRTHASELSVTVLQSSGEPLVGAVIDAVPQSPAPPVRAGLRATMDQHDLMFVPDTIVVRTGTAVDFPNSDNVRHQVYSFSPAKHFQLSLYGSSQHASVVFDQPGLVTVGCNIHDGMIGYIYVTDSPWFGQTPASGTLQLHNLTAGRYTIKVWHARMRDKPDSLNPVIELSAGNATASVTVTLKQPLKPAQHNHGTAKQWEDY